MLQDGRSDLPFNPGVGVPDICVSLRIAGAVAALALSVAGTASSALEGVTFQTGSANDDLREAIVAASLLARAADQSLADGPELLAAAQADYARMLGVLYQAGYYSGEIHVLLDDHEAASIAPLDAPESFSRAVIMIEPGPRFSFGAARMSPYAPGTRLPRDFRDTLPARSTAISEAAAAGVEGWRDLGHAKASVAGQTVIADHAARSLDVAIRLEPGPKLRFGTLAITGYNRMRLNRLRKIAGLPEGEVFSPQTVDDVTARLRRTGIFRSVTLTEAEVPNADGTLDMTLLVAEEIPRRFGFGAELATSDGLLVNGYWLHRNLFGGGERFRVDAEIENVGGVEEEAGYRLTARLDRPASFTPDTSAFLSAEAERYTLGDLRLSALSLGFGLSHVVSQDLTVEAGLTYEASTAGFDDLDLDYRLAALPTRLEWDRRNVRLNATRGFYLNAGVTPFLGFDTTGSGVQIKADARYYRSVAADDRVVLAGRVQLGAILGPTLEESPPDYLFFSGGGGTVRGQPYQSLGVTQTVDSTEFTSGGQSFAALSAEVRGRISDTLSLVGFLDAGFVGAEGNFSQGAWHSGAGLGLRYNTGIGPIRLDVAAPVTGDTGDGIQIYLGIGQAF